MDNTKDKPDYFGKIIDAHGHIYPDKLAAKATASIGDFYSIPMAHTGSSRGIAESGDAIGIRRQLVCSTATSAPQVESVNSFIAGECIKYPSFVGFGTMHPDYTDYEKELGRMKALGLKGVKLHSDFQRFYIDDPRAADMYRAIAQAELPVLFHIGDDRYDYSEPERLRRVMEQTAGLTAIAAHFGGYRRWEHVADILGGIDNLYFDTSSSLSFIPPQTAGMLIERLGEDRFFFGTDFPMWDHREELGRFMSIELDETRRRKILYENFERAILGR